MTPDEHAGEAARLAGRYGQEAVVHALLAIDGRLAVLVAALAGLAEPDHPPVPEQAATPAQAAAVADAQHLWVGWAPGYWPVPDPMDPRKFRWANPLEERG